MRHEREVEERALQDQAVEIVAGEAGVVAALAEGADGEVRVERTGLEVDGRVRALDLAEEAEVAAVIGSRFRQRRTIVFSSRSPWR